MNKVLKEERGWAGHFCGAPSCRFRRNTLLWTGETHIVVSTVGNYWYEGKPEEIGLNRYYETMVFFSKIGDTLYHDADVSREIFFSSPWAIDHISEQSDKEANFMHDTVVLEFTNRIASGEFIDHNEPVVSEAEMESATDFADKLLGMKEPIHPKYLAAVIERRDRVLAAAIRKECADRGCGVGQKVGRVPDGQPR